MKILFYSHSSTTYGATSSMVNLITGIQKLYKNIEIKVVLPKAGPLQQILFEENISCIVIPSKPWYYNAELSIKKRKGNQFLWFFWFYKNKWQRRIYNFLNFKKHLIHAQSYNPDYIYINSSLSPMGAYVAERLNIKSVWHHRETINDSVCHFHLDDAKEFTKLFKKTNLHIYTSKFLAKSYKNFPNGGESLMVYDGVKFKSTHTPQERKLNGNKIKLGMVGRINSQKGQKQIIELFKRIKNKNSYELHIIGDGNKDYINSLNSQPKQDNIIFHGFLPKNEIYNKFDFLIMNSSNEAFGRVVAEANFYGIPVLAKNSGALPEIINPEVNGFIYNTMEELLFILEELIVNSINLSSNAHSHFEENFSIEDCTKKVISKIEYLN